MSAIAHQEIGGKARSAGARVPLLGRFLPSSVRALVIGGFGLLIVALGCVTLGASWQVRQHESDLSQLEYHSTESSFLQTAEAQAAISAEMLQRYVYAGDQSYIPEINMHAAAAQTALEKALAGGGPPGLDQVVTSGAVLQQGAAQATGLEQNGKQAEASAVLEQLVPIFKNYRTLLESLAARELDEVVQLRARADRAGQLTFWLLVTSGGTGVILGLAASFWVARSIIKPLGSLEETARRASQGDLTARAPAGGPREFAHLGSVLNEMMAAIEERTADLRDANGELSQKNSDLIDARNQAATDPLTGLGNHRSFQNRLRQEVTRAQEDGSCVGLIIIDLDGFKDVNDSLGHLAGDQLLRDLAGLLTDVTRDDNTFRYGGDEIAVLLPGAVGADAIAVANGLKKAVTSLAAPDGQPLTASLGIACFPETAVTPEELVYRADMAMYWAKPSGKNRVVVWDPAMTNELTSAPSRYIGGRKEPADVVAAFSAALAAKDPATGEHTERCSWYTAALAAELGLSDEDIATARLASLLHDIGKLVVPDDILCKPGPLTEDEAERIHRHSVDGANMLTQARLSRAPCPASSTTMSTSTAPATPTASPAKASRSSHGSCSCPMPSTR